MSKKVVKEEDVPEFLDFTDQEMMGFENVTPDDLGIPFLMIIQNNSPERDKTSTKFIKGCDQGMIINTISRQIVGGEGEAVMFIPCSYQKMYVEWRPRTSGGGFVASHKDAAILSKTHRDDMGKDVLDSGNIVVPTAYMFGLRIINEDTMDFEKVVISFTSTQLKKARQWLSTMMSIRLPAKAGGLYTPPMFSTKYLLSTCNEKNEKGSWFGWKIERGATLKVCEKPLMICAMDMVKASRNLLPAPAVDVDPEKDGQY
jgi:hypothetical protein